MIVKLAAIFFSMILVNNYVLVKFLGICPFLGVSKKLDSSLGMSGAVIFVMFMATAVTFPIQIYVLDPAGLGYLQTIVFILVIAVLVQFIEIFLKKYMISLYNALGVYLPLITTNCAVLGVAIDTAQKGYDLVNTMIYSVGTAVGFLVATDIMAGIRDRFGHKDFPEAFQRMPRVLETAGVTAIAFVGFSAPL